MIRKKHGLPQLVAGKVRDQINGGLLRPGAKLLPLRQMAQAFNVSQRTVLSALSLLEREKLVVRTVGSGVYVRQKIRTGIEYPKPDEVPKLSADLLRKRAVAESLTRDIVQGIYRVGEYLPLQKVLQHHYRTSKSTMRSALQLLEQRRLVVRQGAGFKVGGHLVVCARKTRLTVYVLGQIEAFQNSLGYRPHGRRARDVYETLEAELIHHGVIHIEFFDLERAGSFGLRRLANQKPLGLVYFLRTGNCSRLEANLQMLSQVSLKTVVYDFHSFVGTNPAFSYPFGKQFFLLGCDDRAAGYRVGTYVAAMGHQNVGLLRFSDQSWARQRLDGAASGLRQLLGRGCTISTFVPNRTYQSLPPPGRIPTAMLKAAVKKGFCGYKFTHSAPDRWISSEISHRVRLDAQIRAMHTVFEQARRHKGITAWICSDNNNAVIASNWLKSKKIRVPHDLSLVAVDEDGNGRFHGITLYDFCPDRIGYLAAHCLLGDIPIRRNRKRIVEIPGRMLVRKSCRRV